METLDTKEKLKKYGNTKSIQKFHKYHENQEDDQYLG